MIIMSVWPGSIDLIKTLPAKAVESQRLVFCHLFKIYYSRQGEFNSIQIVYFNIHNTSF